MIRQQIKTFILNDIYQNGFDTRKLFDFANMLQFIDRFATDLDSQFDYPNIVKAIDKQIDFSEQLYQIIASFDSDFVDGDFDDTAAALDIQLKKEGN